MELGGSAIVCAAIGYAIDHYFQNETMIATALGAILGFSGGLFRFIKLALAASHESNRGEK
jgi:F0F1-type ATP synthase assembly protein I